MKKINFIERIVLEDKIKLVDASEEVAESYNQKSKNSLKAAKILLQQELLEESVSMAYYSMFHKSLSLFYLIGIKCENHAAVIILLKELFNIENEDISYVKKERVDKQYYTDFSVTKDEVIEIIEKAESFIDELEMFINKLHEEDKNNYLADFKATYF